MTHTSRNLCADGKEFWYIGASEWHVRLLKFGEGVMTQPHLEDTRPDRLCRMEKIGQWDST